MPDCADITILGDGQMALVLADALVERGVAANGSVRIWGPVYKHARTLAETRTSMRLRDLILAPDVLVSSDEREALTGATLIINAIPAQFMRSAWGRIGDLVEGDTPIVSVTKGIENDTLLLPSHVIAEVVAGNRTADSGAPKSKSHRPLCALSGPTIAAELAKRLPAAMVAASEDHALAERVQNLFNVPWLRVYSHDDIIGVELAGAVKNVIALAAGMIDGLGAGDNAKSALLARGLAEITRLGLAVGAKRETFFGIAGVGDLATTCFSRLGRNRTCGERLGRGETLKHVLATTVSVVEGVPTARSVRQLADREGVEMPICAAVHQILFESLSPGRAIRDLMSRQVKCEHIG